MPTVTVYDMNGNTVGDVELPESIFGAPFNEALLHDAIVMYEANKRQGTSSTKTRSERRGGGRKPWRQKGTGRARHGSIRSPIWRKGGVTFGPKPRDFRQSMPVKARREATRSALSAKVTGGDCKVVNELVFEAPRTREFATFLQSLDMGSSALVVLDERDQNAILSARNIPGVTTILAKDLNAYDILAHDQLILTEASLAGLEEVLG